MICVNDVKLFKCINSVSNPRLVETTYTDGCKWLSRQVYKLGSEYEVGAACMREKRLLAKLNPDECCLRGCAGHRLQNCTSKSQRRNAT